MTNLPTFSAVRTNQMFYRNPDLNTPHPPTTLLNLPPVQRIHFWHGIKRNKSVNMHLHGQTESQSMRETEIEGEKEQRENRRDKTVRQGRK